MAIQKISPSFGATLKGNYKDIIKLSVNAGLRDKGVKSALKMIHEAFPKRDDKVYMYFRKVISFEEYSNPIGTRSGIKIVKNGKVSEFNVDPRDIRMKNLLYLFAGKVKAFAQGKIKPDETVKIYK